MRSICLPALIITLFTLPAMAELGEGRFADPCAGKLEAAGPDELEKTAKTDTCAAIRLAERYATAKGVTRDLKKSLEYYTVAASSGNPAAQYALGSIYYSGIGTEQNLDAAVDWFLKAAAQNNPYAQMRLGGIYGLKDEKYYDPDKSLSYYEQAAAQGFTRARLSLGGSYYKLKRYEDALNQFQTIEAELPKADGKTDWKAAEAELGLFVSDAYRDNYSRTLLELAGLAQGAGKPQAVAAYVLKAVEVGSRATLVLAGDLYYRGEGVPQDYQKALSYYNQAAGEDIPAAKTRIAIMKLNGVGVDKDTAAAMDLFADAANSGDNSAQMFIADLYFTGKQTAQNYEKAFSYYKMAAKDSDAALFAQAFMTDHGLGVKTDGPAALKIYDQCAEKGYKFALALLGYKYEKGVGGVPKDTARAAGYIRRAMESPEPDGLPAVFDSNPGRQLLPEMYKLLAQHDDYASANALGYLYDKGEFVKRDTAEAIKWYTLAAEKNNTDAQLNLGNVYSSTGNYKAALGWYLKAAQAGSAAATHSAGWVYFNYAQGADALKQAVVLFSSAAERGYAESQVMLGNLYTEGTGVPKDCAQALNWYRKAAATNNPAALAGIGYITASGCAGKKDPKTAVQYYSRAAAMGNPFAMLSLAAMYDTGQGVGKDIKKALEYYTAAASAGDPAGAQGAALILSSGDNKKPDYAKAHALFLQAANRMFKDSYFYLGVLSETGHGTRRSNAEAYKWYYACAKAGGAKAQACAVKTTGLEMNLTKNQLLSARQEAGKYLKTTR